MPRFPWEKNKGEEEPEEKDFSTVLAEALKKQREELEASMANTVDAKLNDRFKSFEPVTSYVEEQKAQAEARRKAAEEEAKKGQELTDEELAERMQTNPREAFAYLNTQRDKTLLQLRADNIRKDTFSDAEKFPYYSGELKIEIDKLLASQPLENQNKVDVVENAYHVIVGRRMKEIQEGKLKSRFASSSASQGSSTTNGETKTRDVANIQVTDEMRKAARLSGIPIDDFVKLIAENEEIEIV